jgi:4,5-DOPA dioxygenase extradiol
MNARMPVLFVGHGSPMNAIEDNEFRRGWAEAGRRLSRPRAVLCVSAHWETRGVFVTAAALPSTIYDFYGFPDELYQVRYPAPGSPALAQSVADLVSGAAVRLDPQRGLDHGAWSVLTAMYPEADVPVLQLSLDATQGPAFHYQLGQELVPLRDEGVLLVGSGNLVHNLRLVDFGRAEGYDWADRFDHELKELIVAREHARLLDYQSLGPDSRRAVPTPEHYLPVLYALGASNEADDVAFFNAKTTLGSISMTSLTMGAGVP